MTDAALIDPSDDLLRLTYCPRCNYSLKGLPDAGKCPECGQGYDQAFVILRGKASPHSEAGAFSLKALLWNSGMVAVLLAAMVPLFRRGVLYEPFVLLMAGYLALITCVSLVGFLSSAHAGDVLVWLDPLGIGEQLPLEPRSTTARLRRWLEYLFSPITLLPSFVGLWSFPVLCISVMGFMIGLQLVARKAGLPKAARPAEGIRPVMFDWRTFSEIQLKALGKNRYRLLAMHSSWIGHRALIDVVIEAADIKLEALRPRIAGWAGPLWRG